MEGQTHSDFIKKILICVLKMNESITGLERHEGESFFICVNYPVDSIYVLLQSQNRSYFI